jgi:hypothetical protein
MAFAVVEHREHCLRERSTGQLLVKVYGLHR